MTSQIVLYGYLSYKIYYETEDTIQNVRMAVSAIAGISTWIYKKIKKMTSPKKTTNDYYEYIDWILVSDVYDDNNMKEASAPIMMGLPL